MQGFHRHMQSGYLQSGAKLLAITQPVLFYVNIAKSSHFKIFVQYVDNEITVSDIRNIKDDKD